MTKKISLTVHGACSVLFALYNKHLHNRKGATRATYLWWLWSPPDKLKLPVGLLFAADAAVRTAEACDHMQQQQRREKHMATDCRPE